MAPPGLGPASGDPALGSYVEPLLRDAGVRDRASVGLFEQAGTRWAHFGAGPDTVYEIGSVTKTMTALLFAMAVESAGVRVTDPLGNHLGIRDHELASVTLEELAGHRSGLPRLGGHEVARLVDVLAVLRHRNPYRADTSRVLARANAARLEARGSFGYSNLGYALLGQVLSARARLEYTEFLDRSLLRRLGMTASSAPLTARDLPPAAPTGWSSTGKRVRAWTMNGYAPAGGVRSTPADLARYVLALLDGDLSARRALTPRWGRGDGGRVGYAWLTDEVDGRQITWHDGRTGGFASMLALDVDRGTAVVMLANTAVGLDRIAIDVLLDEP